MKLALKVLETNRNQALATLGALENSNICKNEETKLRALEILVVAGELEGIYACIKLFGTYSKVSPGFTLMENLRDELVEAYKSL